MLISSILSTFIFFFFREPVPRGVFIIFYVVAFILIVYLRKILNKRMLAAMQERILLVGDGKISLEVAQSFTSNPYLRIHLVGYVSQGDGSQGKGEIPRLGGIDDLIPIASEKAVDKIVIAVANRDKQLINLLVQCMRQKIELSEFRTVLEEITGRVPIDHLNDNWFLYQLSKLNKRYFWYMKRFADIIIAGIGLCIALPLFPFLAIIIKLDSKGPIFYTQQRMGRGSVPFRAWKLRTMVDGADSNNVHWTTDGDSRITRVGKIVRKTRLDEVPQLLNIFKGEMTLIGPRPEALSLVEMYTREIPYYFERHMVTPGISGWAQINYPYGNSIEDARQKLMFDFYYIKNRSVILDLMIFVRTIRTVFTGHGAM